ncbi:uncharacterized protein EKO05_0008736 [Ascochyta rabiei]|uniref:uncharacterized protein n=1 Tax=Didymella rabiei TaxID=5454 RepID=UPI00220E7FF3|nr:uncharacterized protein EKO05_0008736 [Ascochyta rabiei]UPX18436.1 hypothetical protein EKO05_0008736 [Ascochyta rabiei]
MFNLKVLLNIALLVVLVIARSQPHVHLKPTDSDNDDFWAKKPMHTTDLMAGKSHSTLDTTVTRTHVPTGIPSPQIPQVEVDEL